MTKIVPTSFSAETLKHSLGPATWLMSVLFFIVATPFEITQSGYVYLVKVASLGALAIYAIAFRGARTGPLNILSAFVVTSFLLTNLINWSDRAAIAVLCIVAGTLLGQARGKNWDTDFRSILSLFIFVHFGALLFANFTFYTTGELLDLHNIVFPGDSRAEAKGALARLSGFHTEPGTYAQWTLMVLYLLALTRGHLLSYRHVVIVLSVLITFSLWGFLAVGVFVLAFLIEAIIAGGFSSKARGLLGVIALCILVSAVAMLVSTDLREDALDYLSLKASLTTESGYDKVTATQFFKDNFSRVLILGEPLNPGFCPQCISPQDAGLGLNGTYYMGLLLFSGLMISAVVQVTRSWNFSFAVPLLLIFFWKANIYEPLLWIILGYISRGPSKKIVL